MRSFAPMSQRPREFYTILLAFFIIYFVWGSTYLANSWALDSLPPFLLAGIRFTIAAFIMLCIARTRKKIKLTKAHFKSTLLAGFMFFALGNGLAVWGLQYVESGIAALLIALQPIVVALFLWSLKGQRPVLLTWLGLIVGLIGMAVLIGQPQFIGNSSWLLGLLSLVVAVISWSFISIWIGTAPLPSSVFVSAAFQMLFGGIILLVISTLLGEFRLVEIKSITTKSYFSMIYLVIFGSIVAFTAFNYLLLRVSPVKVSTATYVNPVIAIYLGWWLNHEEITFYSILASGLLLLGVFLINMGKRRTKKKTI